MPGEVSREECEGSEGKLEPDGLDFAPFATFAGHLSEYFRLSLRLGCESLHDHRPDQFERRAEIFRPLGHPGGYFGRSHPLAVLDLQRIERERAVIPKSIHPDELPAGRLAGLDPEPSPRCG